MRVNESRPAPVMPAGPDGGDGRLSICVAVEALVCGAFGIGRAEIGGRTRGRAKAAFARQVAMYLAHVSLGVSQERVARHFGRDRTTVSHGCARVEDSRDDPRLDRILLCLEHAVASWRGDFTSGRS